VCLYRFKRSHKLPLTIGNFLISVRYLGRVGLNVVIIHHVYTRSTRYSKYRYSEYTNYGPRTITFAEPPPNTQPNLSHTFYRKLTITKQSTVFPKPATYYNSLDNSPNLLSPPKSCTGYFCTLSDFKSDNVTKN
jgi:hypothetical protein